MVITGNLTEKSYQRKKLKLTNEIDASTGSEGKTISQQLSSVASNDDQMADTLMKLFKKPHPVSPLSTLPKAKGKSSAKKPQSVKLISKAIETVIIQKQTQSIPQGEVRKRLHMKGYIKMLQFFKSDTEPSVCERVYQLFKHILSSHDSFQFLSAKSKSLVLVTPEVLGHATWNGEAILALAGQGSLYLLPTIAQEVSLL